MCHCLIAANHLHLLSQRFSASSCPSRPPSHKQSCDGCHHEPSCPPATAPVSAFLLIKTCCRIPVQGQLCVCVCARVYSVTSGSATPWTVACQDSMPSGDMNNLRYPLRSKSAIYYQKQENESNQMAGCSGLLLDLYLTSFTIMEFLVSTRLMQKTS